ncbi:MAG: c-di-GMP phosphodiesterase [Campylobacterota bacterium]|nr:c-di-GMP phosphodiesterase [Campylobacterota bacterium]
MFKLNDNFLKAIPLLFFIIVAFKVFYQYIETKNRQYEFAQKETEVLNSYVIENRNYYQKLFFDGTVELNEKTLLALPAYSSHIISEKFSKNNPLNITLKTVSDRARNSKNQADKNELKAIEFFKKNPNETKYFDDSDNHIYQYAKVLKIDASCLKCHGKKEEAPSYIQERYANAYDYALEDVRGIISIQIPKKNLDSYFFKNFFKSILFDLSLFLLLFLGVAYILRESKKLNSALEEKVKTKTDELKNSFLLERLTKLPNRLKLIEDIEQNKNASSIHLALINVDSFKNINDLYGYDVGDKILIEISKQIRRLCQNPEFVYKLPNDEFAILTTVDISKEEFFKATLTLLHKINEMKFNVAEQSIAVSFSCGVASNESSILIKANTALQIAKKHSKSVVAYDSSLDAKEQIAKNLDALVLLKDAIKNDRIIPYYQPIYNTRTQKIERYEALARIITQDSKVIAPFAFLDVAIKSKLYPEITKAMISKSFEFFKDKDLSFSINLSILDIQNQETMKFIEERLNNYDASKVVFEILESDKIEDYKELKHFIQVVKKFGCKIAIDDFGSGYSNFSHIFELNVDYLKIDASLVKFITTDNSSRVIVKTIINFATNLGLKTVAEFVEDKDALDLLEKMGVDFVQGYYIGKPDKELVKD